MKEVLLPSRFNLILLFSSPGVLEGAPPIPIYMQVERERLTFTRFAFVYLPVSDNSGRGDDALEGKQVALSVHCRSN